MTIFLNVVLIFFCIVTFFVMMMGVPFMLRLSFNRSRRKGYRPFGAGLIALSPWGIGTLGFTIWAVHRFETGSGSYLFLLAQLWILLLVIPFVSALIVRVLPRRSGRSFGPRRLPFSIVGLAWVVTAIWMMLSLAIPVTLWLFGKADIGDVWIGAGVALCGLPIGIVGTIYFHRYDLAVRTPLSLEEYLTADPRPPVLYLRPFQMESYVFAEKDERNLSFEQFLCESLREIGPFVALGNPEDYVPALDGASRLYASDIDWFEKLGELARRSRCIVVETGRSENLQVEYEYLRREGMHEKLFIFTGHPESQHRRWLEIWGEMVRFGILRLNWQAFAAELAKLGYDLAVGDPGLGSVITFDVKGRGIVLTTQAKTAAEFVDPIRAWIERREMPGRCIPTSCLSCSQEFFVFPADAPAFRERWCRKCDVRLNTLQRAVKRFCTRHQTLTAWFGFLSIVAVPIVISFVLPEASWASAYWGWLGTLLFFLELAVLLAAFVCVSLHADRRLERRYKNLAEAGDAVAMANLGIMYWDGKWSGSATGAAEWSRKAAQAGDIGGMINLAGMLEKGIGGLPKDFDEAASWYQRAADLGSRTAQEGLKRLQNLN